MSKRSVRLALETSVAWTAAAGQPPEQELSTVPKQSSPASARARRSGDESRMWAIFGPEK